MSEQSFAVVNIEGLRKSYAENEVLKGIDLEIKRKEVVSVIGKSGSGKSTLLRCINGLEYFQQGRIEVDGQALVYEEKKLRELRMNVGMIFQSFNLFPHLTAAENVMLAPRLVRKIPYESAIEQAKILLNRVGLADKPNAYPRQLSGGQQQRVAIARALAMGPEVLLCDEITSALDPELVGEVLNVIETLADEGMTIIMVTHEMNFAKKVSDRVVFMHQGKVHEIGTPMQIFDNPQTPELRQFLSVD